MRRSKAMGFYMNKQYAQADTLYGELFAEGDTSFLTLKYGVLRVIWPDVPWMRSICLEWAYGKDTTDVETNLLLGAALGKTYDRKPPFLLFDQAEKLMQPNEALVNMLLTSRSETLFKDGRQREAEGLLYKAWLANKDRLDLLFRIEQEYSNCSRSINRQMIWPGLCLPRLHS